MCISWTNKEFDIINARYNHEDSIYIVRTAEVGNSLM
jgi:hypothetical protein